MMLVLLEVPVEFGFSCIRTSVAPAYLLILLNMLSPSLWGQCTFPFVEAGVQLATRS